MKLGPKGPWKKFCKRGHERIPENLDSRRACKICSQSNVINKRVHWRAAVYALLGAQCNRCGFADVRALQIDHVFADAHEDRRRFAKSNRAEYYQHVVQNPDRYQILCANCNWIKRVEGDEVNQWKRDRKAAA